MNNSRPLLLLVIILCLVFVALASFWVAALPNRMLASVTHKLSNEQGLTLEASSPTLSFRDGISLQLENVSLEDKSGNAMSLSAQHMHVGTALASLFGAGVSAQDIVLQKAVVAIEMSKPIDVFIPLMGHITLEDSSLRFKDEQRKSVIALSDVNGDISIAATGEVKAKFTFLMGDILTTFSGEIENAQKWAKDGSPTDFVLSAKDMLVAVSGQSRLAKGLEVTGQSSVEANDAAAFMRWFGMQLATLEAVGPLQVQSGFSTNGLSAKFEKLTGKIGASNISANVTFASGIDRPALIGDIDVSRIVALGPKLDASVFTKPWSEQPLPFADAKSIEFNLNLKTSALVLRGHDMGSLELKLTSDDKNTSFGISQQPFAGGQIEGNFSFENEAKNIISFGAVTAKGVDAQTFLGGLLGWRALAGNIDVTTNFKSEGTTPGALVSYLKGDFELQSKVLSLEGMDLQKAITAASVGWTGSKTTLVQANVVADINEGVLVLRPSDIKALDFTLKPKGEIDLLRQAFELQLQPKGKNVDTKMTLTGHWNSPTFSNAIAVKEKPPVTPPAN